MPCYLYSRNLKLLITFDTFQFHFAFLNFRCNSEFHYLLKLQFWIASDIIMQLYDVCAVRLTLVPRPSALRPQDATRAHKFPAKRAESEEGSQSWAMLARLSNAFKAEQYFQNWAMLARLNNALKAEQCSQSWAMLSKLSKALKAEKYLKLRFVRLCEICPTSEEPIVGPRFQRKSWSKIRHITRNWGVQPSHRQEEKKDFAIQMITWECHVLNYPLNAPLMCS